MKQVKLIAATYAPMNQNTSLNLSRIKEYKSFLDWNQVNGAFINGSTGDFPSLSVEERKSILTEWAKHKTDNFSIINHVGHTSLDISKDLARHSVHLADAIATLPPFYYNSLSLENLTNFCCQVAACAPSLPFYYYHLPEYTGVRFDMKQFLENVTTCIPNFAGIKFSANDLLEFSHCINFNGKLELNFGVDGLFLSSLPYGVSGWIGSTYNHLASLYYAINEAFENNDFKHASVLQSKSLLFIDTLNQFGGFNGTGKSFMKVIGLDCGPSRFPHATLSTKTLNQISSTLKMSGIMEFVNTIPRNRV